MRFFSITTVSFIFAISSTTLGAQAMDNQKLYQILESVGKEIEGRDGAWQFTYEDRIMMLLTDETHDRMRVISPVGLLENISDTQIREAMAANFHTALDAKYAISDDLMWSVFMHPLSQLSEKLFLDALSQVHRAAETFGTDYSSTDLVFPGGEQKQSQPDAPVRKM